MVTKTRGSRHTPGLWRTARRLGDDKEGSIAIITDDGQYIGCTDAMLEGRYDEARNKANAQLWAAAPELLGALEEITNLIASPSGALFVKIDMINGIALAAIKKGETQ